MSSISNQYLLSASETTTQLLLDVPDTRSATIDLHIINLYTIPIQVSIWTTYGEETDIDESGIWETGTDLFLGDNIMYSGKPIGAGQKVYIKVIPYTTHTNFKLSAQISGFME